jgi:hypothetical protein
MKPVVITIAREMLVVEYLLFGKRVFQTGPNDREKRRDFSFKKDSSLEE